MKPLSGLQRLLPCPCCGSLEFETEGDYEICRLCNWQNDPVQLKNPDYAGGANRESLNQAKEEWQAGRRIHSRFAPRFPG